MVRLDGAAARHIRLVLRLKKDSKIRLVDEHRNLHLAVVEKVTDRAVDARILESSEHAHSRVRLAIVQGIPRVTKADLITQKLTELGADSIVFVPVRYSPYPDAFDRISKRLPRLENIAKAASQQCARHDIPDVTACADLETAAENLDADDLLLVADPEAGSGSLSDHIAGAGVRNTIAVFIGPEGGLSAEETQMLEERGAAGFSLGRNILRTETAAIVATAIILYELGEI